MRSVARPYAFMRSSIEGLPPSALPLLAREWDLVLAGMAAPFARTPASPRRALPDAASNDAAREPLTTPPRRTSATTTTTTTSTSSSTSSTAGDAWLLRTPTKLTARSLSMPLTAPSAEPSATAGSPLRFLPVVPSSRAVAATAATSSGGSDAWPLQPLQRSLSMDLLVFSPGQWPARGPAAAAASDADADATFALRAQVAQRFVRLVDWSNDPRVPLRALVPLVRELGLRTSGSKELLISRLLLHLLPLDRKPLEARAAWMRPQARDALRRIYLDQQAAASSSASPVLGVHLQHAAKRRKLLPSRRSDGLDEDDHDHDEDEDNYGSEGAAPAAARAIAPAPAHRAAPAPSLPPSIRAPATLRATTISLTASELPASQLPPGIAQLLGAARFELRGAKLEDDRCFVWGLPLMTRVQFAAFVASTTAPAPRHVAPFVVRTKAEVEASLQSSIVRTLTR